MIVLVRQMKPQHFETEHEGLRFHIEGTYPEGAYLYIFDDKDKQPFSKFDYLQDDIEGCISFAFDYYQVPVDSWRILPDNTKSYFDNDCDWIIIDNSDGKN